MKYKKYNDDEYKEMRKQLDILFYNEGEYDECLKRTKEFLDYINYKKASNYNFFFTYMMYSKIYNNMNESEKAIMYVKLAEKYLYEYKEATELLILLKWQYGMCYKKINKIKAVNNFHHCFILSMNKKNYEFASGLMEEIALLNNSAESMLYAIDLYKTKADVFDHIDKQNRLDEMNTSLFNIYVKNNDEINASRTIHNIKNKSKVKKLKDELRMLKTA